MLAIPVQIVRFVEAHPPGFVECRFVDVWGQEWRFVEKLPVVTGEDLEETSLFPRPGVLACQVLQKQRDTEGREIVTIDTSHPWEVKATGGETQFEVLGAQLFDT